MITRHERVFRRFLRLYPGSFRAGYEDQLIVAFRDQIRDATEGGRPFAKTEVLVRSLFDIALTAPAERLRHGEPVPQPTEPAAIHLALPRRTGWLVRGITALPLVVWTVLSLVAPGFTDPVYDNPPGVLGLPAGILLLLAGLAWGLLGMLIVWRTTSSVVTVAALVLFTVPATIAIVLGPAWVLVIQQLAV
jgi:hypothetical protein